MAESADGIDCFACDMGGLWQFVFYGTDFNSLFRTVWSKHGATSLLGLAD